MKRRCWRMSELKFLRQAYSHQTARALAEAIGCTIYAVYHKTRELGLRKNRYPRRR